VNHIPHDTGEPDSPLPPDEGWWHSILQEEDRRARDEVPPHGPRNAEDGGSTADWLWARNLYEQDELVDLPVVGYNRGGLLVQAQGMRGFVPLSHVLDLCRETALTQPPDLERFVGRTLRLRVIEFDPERGRLVLSERAAQAAPGRRLELLRCLQPGERVVGLVSNLTAFGAFVDLGGVEGLIHVSEISWGRVRHPADVLRLGEKVEAVVLSTDPDLGRIALSLKELRADPWASLDRRVRLGDTVDGVVTSVVRFGAFVEIEEGVEGLVHVSELGAASPCDPASVVREGDRLRLRVIRFDPSQRKLGLSLRAIAASSASDEPPVRAASEPA
jgi:small subunit ribosomal protein S1